MSNWKKHKDQREDNLTVTIPYKEYKKIEAKLTLADKIESLDDKTKETVYSLIELLLED